MDETKVGRRNSEIDLGRIQAAHDLLYELGAECLQESETVTLPILSLPDDDAVVYAGNAVKALGEGKVGGYLVRFSSPDDPDLEGEFFTAATDFGEYQKSPVFYQHGADEKLKLRRIGNAELHQDEAGIWAEAQLHMRDEYEKYIYEMAEAGTLGWSSGTAGHLVIKEPVGKAKWLKSWPLGLDASLTPTPAEYRNTAIPLKSLITEAQARPGEGVPGAVDGAAEATIETDQPTGVIKMEITKEELAEMLSGAASQAAEKALASLPPVDKPDVQVTQDEGDQPWPHAGKFFTAVKNAALYGHQEPKLKKWAEKATGMSEGVPADGGYLVPPQFASGILENVFADSQLLSRVSMDPVAGNVMNYNAVDETSRALGSHLGGVTGYWLAEGGSITGSKPKFRQIELKLKKIGALCYATDEQLEDTANLESWLARSVPAVLRYYVEDAILNGDGQGKPLGILNSGALLTLLRVDASEIDATDIAQIWAHRLPGVNDYVWVINPEIFPQLFNLAVGNFPVYLPQGITGSLSGTLLGRPVIESEHAAALGSAGDILLASPSNYQMISKGGVKAASSIHVSFATDETAFRFTYRCDGSPIPYTTMTTKSGTSCSPFVALGASV